MKTLMMLLVGLFLALPVMIGCEQNEVKVERRESVKVQSEPRPVVVPDAPAER